MENYHTLLNELISGSETDESTIQPPETKRKPKLKLKRKTATKEKNRNPKTNSMPSEKFRASFTGTEDGEEKRKCFKNCEITILTPP